MAVTTKFPKHIDRVAAAFRESFAGADVSIEKVEGVKKFRFVVTWEGFAKLGQMKRQEAAWNVVDRVLTSEQSLDVSVVLTMAPEPATK